jgi:hypothetical protein
MFGFMKKKSSDAAGAKQKKSKGYYLELDEAKSVGTAPAPEVVVSEPVQTEVTTAEDRTDAALIAPAKAPKTAAKATKPEAKTEAKTESKTESKPAPKPVAIAIPEPEILPAYLQPNNTPRRRPGANMAMFKNIAEQIKNP